jgi:stage III sporulation protein AB
LKSLQTALKLLATEISYALSPLPEAMANVAARSPAEAASLFRVAGAELAANTGGGAAQAWQKATARFGLNTSLTGNDLALVNQLGQALGISDRDDQMSHLELVLHQIDLQIDEAQAAAAKNARLWNYLGFLGGLALALILY